MSHFNPTQPLASTRDEAVVGVAGTPSPINDRGFPPIPLNVDTLGVVSVGNGNDELEVNVIVLGVRDISSPLLLVLLVGEGGNTNNV